jgi:hypothetical protein
MALVSNFRAPQQAQAQQNDSWKADAFLNVWVDVPGGKPIKLGAMSYKAGRKMDAHLMEMLQQPGAVGALLKHIRLDFQMVEDAEGKANPFAFLASQKAADPAQAAS